MGRIGAALVALTVLAGAASPAEAGLFGLKKKPAAEEHPIADTAVREIQRALDEQRYVDAGKLLDQALTMGAKDPRLTVQLGEVQIVRGRYEGALAAFTEVAADPAVGARAQQGRGVALSLLGRSDEALPALKAAVESDKSLWRAWNALGREYDARRDWAGAEAAYAAGLQASGGKAAVYNNRGFSRMLQQRYDEAAADFVAALEKDPNLGAARSNLRLALAMKGDYDRATASGPREDGPAVLNNAGYAAMLRGDLAKAELLFTQAMAGRGEFYARASENLALVKKLRAQEQAGAAKQQAGASGEKGAADGTR